MTFTTSYPKYPELVIGLAGPIGIDIDAMIRTLQDTLKTVGYQSCLIRVTDLVDKIDSGEKRPAVPSFYNLSKFKMDHVSALCRKHDDPAFLMRLAMAEIQKQRKQLLTFNQALDNQDDAEESVVTENVDHSEVPFFNLTSPDKLALRSAYIVRQIKRPEEVSLLRYVYGPQFILVSGYGIESDRQKILREKIRLSEASEAKESREIYLANQLIEHDANEDTDVHGQHLRDAFHLADVVVDGISRTKMRADFERFINGLFGLNEIAPTKAEYGMYAAYSASLRSSDLSRQVGAAIFSQAGDILASGCNEVPKAFGGTYWDTEGPDNRDVKLGKDSNDILKVDVLKDLITRMKKNGLLADKVIKAGSPTRIVNYLIGREKGKPEFDDIRGSLKSAKILDLTEYGRVVHAEMNSICDAARTGIGIGGSTLYTTTFPCHNCTKHIIASGVKEVVFLEPYPKSKAKELHENEVEIESSSLDKVSFNFFSGITPARYETIFKKEKRKKDGMAVRWQHGGPAPMIFVKTPSYIELEKMISWSEEDASNIEEEPSPPKA